MERPLDVPFWPLVVVLLLGFAIGSYGHAAKSKTLILLGIGMILLATLVLPLLIAAGA